MTSCSTWNSRKVSTAKIGAKIEQVSDSVNDAQSSVRSAHQNIQSALKDLDTIDYKETLLK